MPIAVTCACGKSFTLKDQMAGQTLTCPRCNNPVQVPAAPVVQAQADTAFDRDVFLINQKIRIDAKYQITDEQGTPILFVVRPAYLLRNLLAVAVGFAAAVAWVFAFTTLATAAGKDSAVAGLLILLGGLGFIPVLLVVAVALSKKRHTTIYRDEAMSEELLTVQQDRKWQFITWTYTVTTPNGGVLARLSKNMLYNLFRKRWYLDAPDGRRVATAREDSIILSMLRRLLGPLFGLLRTNFVIMRGDSEDVIGEFNRKYTILDKYVLDLKADRQRTLDRRLALAMGLMLDTGERR